MFDGLMPTRFPSNLPRRTEPRMAASLILTAIVALIGLGLTLMLPSDYSEGFHIEMIAP